MKRTAILLSAVVLGLVLPGVARAQTGTGETTSPWGLHVGLASDPDQVVGGGQFLETRIADNVYIVPNAELGIGDDAFVLMATAPVHYRFEVDSKARPYAGGGVSVGWIDFDRPGNDDRDFEIAIRATGGVLWELKSGQEMFAELNLMSGDFSDAQIVVGWRF